MAQSGFTPIQLYYSITNSSAPVAGNLVYGELALNSYNGKLYYKNYNTGLVSLLADGSVSSGNLPGGSTGSVVYQSSTGVTAYLTIGSAGSLLYSNGTAPVYASIGAAGSIIYSNGTAPTTLAIGGANTVLTSTGSAPQFVNQSTLAVGSATTATTATNLAGGTANQVPYQTGVGATSFVAAPTTANYVLTWSGSALGWASVPSVTSSGNLLGGAAGDVVYQSATNASAFLPDVAIGNALISGGVGVAPSYGKIGLTTHVSGILPVANGGTNASTASITSFNNITGYTASGATGTTSTNIVFSTSPTITTATLVTPNITTGLNLTGSAGTSGQALLSQGSGNAPVWGTAGITTGKSIAMAMIFGF